MDKNKANLLTQDTPETSSDEEIEAAFDPDPRNQRNQGILSAVKNLIASTPKTKNPSSSLFQSHLNTSNQGTDTSDLPSEDKIERLRPELNILLTVLIKQTRIQTKAEHHTKLLQESIDTQNPPRGLRPKITPRIPNSKTADFIIDWEEATNKCALSYTSILKDHWKKACITAQEEVEKIRERLLKLNTTQAEWNHIDEILEKIKRTTEEDLQKRETRPRRNQRDQPQFQQETGATAIIMNPPSTSREYSHVQLPQREKRTGDLNERKW